ncbi:MAG TPA: glycoside hydrolase family 2 protein [Candidatus Limnocylindrales bacterium]|nr:glycoside hydrolase family 2 protein [Candidatus Limnocylindrales bacterium]
MFAKICSFISLFAVACLGSVSLAATLQKQTVSLNSAWEFRQVPATTPTQAPAAATNDATQWRPAVVPGSVHLDLLRNKLIPDPFYRDNEAKLQWIENADWEYRTTVQAAPALLAQKNIDLVFEGLDAYSKVYLNDKLILTADNMFRQWRVNVKADLKPGANTLRVVFPSPIKAASEIAANDPWRERTHTEPKTYIRKAAYEFGWDWGPRFVTSGIWRPVRLEAWDTARISNVHIRQLDVSNAVAHLLAEVEVTASEAGNATISLEYGVTVKHSDATRTVELQPGVNHVTLPIDISNPQLWYPAGYGAQPIYKFQVQLKSAKQTLDEATAKTGLRSIVLRREPDQWGRSFEFVVNGIPVFGKGADVIPFDSFPTRVTTQQYRQVLQSAVDANMNMIRHWGGGYYETDEFYDLCDELGIMIWQDFMFGNDWQPGTYDWKLNVAQEAEQQLKRLRNHPSIVIWCGNNETEAALAWKDRDKLSPDVRFQMWQDYVSTFSGILAAAVNRLAPETPYWPSSPSADYEELSDKYQSGDMHDWSVWHGRVPFADYEKHNPRFMTEYGFQSFPEMRTVETFTIPEDRLNIFTPVMLAHQKNAAGNAIIRDYMLRDYPQPKDFASFLYASQVLQAEGIKIGAEHLRRNRPRTMGSIYWQLNDCWPVASWSSLDYYGRWKALHYYARRFYAPVLVSPHQEEGNVAVYVVSDKIAPMVATLRVRILGFDGAVLSDKSQTIQVAPLASKVYLTIPMLDITNLPNADLGKIFAATDLLVDNKVISTNTLFFVPTKDMQLPQAKIESKLTAAAPSNVGAPPSRPAQRDDRVGSNPVATESNYTLHLSSPVLAESAYISFGNLDAKPSDNYFDLLPGQPVDLTITSAASLDELKTNMRVISLTDAFAPHEATVSAGTN